MKKGSNLTDRKLGQSNHNLFNLCSGGQIFIGMCSYYSRFIPNVSQIAEPIIALTRKYAHFKWSAPHQSAFEYLKDSCPTFSLPDSNKPYVLSTDASDTFIGACFTKDCDGDEKTQIYYLSYKLCKFQCKIAVCFLWLSLPGDGSLMRLY